MEVLKINGNKRLNGVVEVGGAKNSVTALIPATLLTDEPITLNGLPNIQDVDVLLNILVELGATVKRDKNSATISCKNIKNRPLQSQNIQRLRASYYFMSVMLSRFNKMKSLSPGGCNLGPRPIDIHLNGFEKLGASVKSEQDGMIELEVKNITGNVVKFPRVSVGATINLIMLAVKAEGETVLKNTAVEPEILDLVEMLNKMGAKISVDEENRQMTIVGVKKLSGTTHTVIPDRIEAGTYLTYAVALGDDVTVKNINPNHLTYVIKKLKEMGANLTVEENSIVVKKNNGLKAIHIETKPYPSFPTDLQQPFLTLMTQATGVSSVTERIFSSRFRHTKSLRKMGANLEVIGKSAYIKGQTNLNAIEANITDLRAGSALVLAGLLAVGETILYNIEHIYRGYEHFVEKLQKLGADIEVFELN